MIDFLHQRGQTSYNKACEVAGERNLGPAAVSLTIRRAINPWGVGESTGTGERKRDRNMDEARKYKTSVNHEVMETDVLGLVTMCAFIYFYLDIN